jgi:hypothetical protein
MCVNRQLCGWINHILAQPISAFHQCIQIVPAGMHLHPSRMILWRGRLCVAQRLEPPRVVDFPVTPYPIRPHVCAIKTGFAWVKYHAVNCGLVTVFEVLYVFVQMARGADGENVAIARIVVKGIAIYGVWRLLSCEEKDGAGLGIGIVRFSCQCSLASQ